MLRKFKISVITSALVLVALVSFSSLPANKELVSCVCSDATFNNRLPQSHPANRCAKQLDEESGVSWMSWIFGHGNSIQFHYLDLLELLSRNSSAIEEPRHTS
ncbi:hypothetical protein [Neptunicella sp. SCSIO 80796]|uniref:hypothetical protein n=1 Tax=Neptunicella plasticusilytica TaxID=3117012 RepID=UPI003A4DD13D